ncbi:MAG: DUF255 domain-containing protein [Gammaproteobacteria bacterium]|nr:DUF255 domain-containing protein [Gammaproteobacteria bacterium]MCP5135351.1 DUF255 domain-containing protein [Gammaproteobacteria bacterium]
MSSRARATPMLLIMLGCAAATAQAPTSPATGEPPGSSVSARDPEPHDISGPRRTPDHDAPKRPVHANRLSHEASPYLLQHAHNPVDWYPWGDEALEKARREDKPIFLSIGYSACHWCHVMERESFEDPAVAELLNRWFVPVKVDRERRPDLDAAYMSAVRLLSGRGGWPMSVFLTPDGRPFFGDTYVPRDEFVDLLETIRSAWDARRDDLIARAGTIVAAIAVRNVVSADENPPGEDTIVAAVEAILLRADRFQGGFGQAPKFPNEPYLNLLLARAERSGDESIIATLVQTLDAMARGGIHDQIGGGFHRYSTDPAWLVPHFEKMLYNQAQLGRIYLRAWSLTGNRDFAAVARDTLDHVLRDMQADTGGFHSATDADSDGGEGRYFLWMPAQITAVLTEDDARLAMDLYDITEAADFEDGNIPHLPAPLSDYASTRGLDLERLHERVERINQRLLSARRERPAPLRDDKIITAWNGMMIATLADAGDRLGEPRYLDAAVRAAEFIWNHNHGTNEGLRRAALHGKTTGDATQRDHAFLAEGLLTLFDVTRDPRWLERARTLADAMLGRFRDARRGGFFLATEDALPAGMPRTKDVRDTAMPSGNAAALNVLQRLSRRVDEPAYAEYARETASAFAGTIRDDPPAHASLLGAIDELWHGETGAHQSAANGAITVDADVEDTTLTVRIAIAPGWHINAHHPLSGHLIPTELGLSPEDPDWRLSAIDYPAPEHTTTGFQEEPMALYSGRVSMTADIREADPSGPAILTPMIWLRLQACTDEACLLPETLRLRATRQNDRAFGFYTVSTDGLKTAENF